MKAHPYADLFPMADADQLVELANDIKENGQEEKGKTYDGMLLDGRNREAACLIAEVEFQHEPYTGKNPLAYVVSKNLRRRHLTPAIRAEIGVQVLKISTELGAPVTEEEAAAALDVSRSTLQRAKRAKKEKQPAASWTPEELKADSDAFAALKSIAAVYGNDDTRSIRTGGVGLKRADVLYLATLDKETMLQVHDLVMAEHWTPQESVAFLKRFPTEKSTFKDGHLWCLGTTEKIFVVEIDGFRTTTELITKKG